jgi:hypothetical protein
MHDHVGTAVTEQSANDQAERGCACVQRGGRSHSSAPATSCACETVEEVVQRSRRTGAVDIVKVVAFAALLVGVGVGLALLL